MTSTLINQFNGFTYKGLKTAPWDNSTNSYHYSESVSSDSGIQVVQGLYFDNLTFLPRYTSSYGTDDSANIYVTEYVKYEYKVFTAQDLSLSQYCHRNDKQLFLY